MKRKSMIISLTVPLLIEWVISLGIQILALVFVKNPSLYIMELTLVISLLTIPILWWLYKKDERDGRWGKKIVPVEWLKMTGVGILSCVVCNVVIGGLNLEQFSSGYGEVSSAIYGSSYLMQIVTTVVVAPIQEEIIYRGLIYGRMREVASKLPAILCSSLIFGICHGNLVQFVFAFFIGIILCVTYEKYGKIRASIWVHMVVNFISLCLTWVLSVV